MKNTSPVTSLKNWLSIGKGRGKNRFSNLGLLSMGLLLVCFIALLVFMVKRSLGQPADPQDTLFYASCGLFIVSTIYYIFRELSLRRKEKSEE